MDSGVSALESAVSAFAALRDRSLATGVDGGAAIQWAAAGGELTKVSGRLQASLSFVEVSDILEQDAGAYLHNILQQCRQTHDLIYRVYIQYSVEAALAM